MRIKHISNRLTLEVRPAKKPWTAKTIRNTTCFLQKLLWMTILFSRQLNLMQWLFSLTRGSIILTQKSARSWCKQMYELTFLSERRKVGAKVRARFPFRSSRLPLNDRPQQLRGLKKLNVMLAVEKDIGHVPIQFVSENPDTHCSYDDTTTPFQPTEEGHNMFRS